MRIVLALGVCAVLLAGCGPGMWEQQSTAEQQSTVDQQPASSAYQLPAAPASQQPAMTQSQRQAAKDDAICRSYGTYPGTTPYVQCRLGLRSQEKQNHDDESPLGHLFD